MKFRVIFVTIFFLFVDLAAVAQVTGQGTNNSVAFWTGSNTLGLAPFPTQGSGLAVRTYATTTTLELQVPVQNNLGPVLTLTNTGGYGGAAAALDFNSYPPSVSTTGPYNPAARIYALDNNNFSDDIYFQSNTSGAKNQGLQTNMIIMSTGPAVGIGTSKPQATLDVNGTTITRVLTITGGSDLAEPFQLSTDDVPDGAVVVIDEDRPGELKLSEHAYDTRVAGVVSGANGVHPGISMRQDGTGVSGQNVALSGRVYVLADTADGPIKPGDLLTTSATRGYAMKVSDHAQAQGAILGKAMTGLSEGHGLVLMLVTLQ